MDKINLIDKQNSDETKGGDNMKLSLSTMFSQTSNLMNNLLQDVQ